MDGSGMCQMRREQRQGRLCARRLQLFSLVALAALLGTGLLGCSSSADDATPTTTAAPAQAASNGPPIVDTAMVAPTVIDVPYVRRSFTVTPEAGGAAGYGDAAVVVPAGAVSKETTIDIKRLTFPFHSEDLPESPPPDAAIGLGDVYDFGPAGLVFDRPVTVTVPYDEGSLPEGFSENDIGLVYWNGVEWILCAGLVNTEDNTVSVQFERFDGNALKVVVVTALATVIIGTGVYIYNQLSDPERINSDAVMEGKASDWITPDDPEVQRRAAQAGVLNGKTGFFEPLDAPDLGEWMAVAAKNKQLTTLVYRDPEKGDLKHVDYTGKGSNWQKPSDLFANGADIQTSASGQTEGGPLWGDCTDITNAAVSVLRAKGFPAQAVYGRAKGTGAPHVWTEVVIGDQIYRIENNGDFASEVFDECGHFDRYDLVLDPNDPFYNSTWDEEGQRPYSTYLLDKALAALTTSTTEDTLPSPDPDIWGDGELGDEYFSYVGTYEGTIKGFLSGGGESADVVWHFTVDSEGVVSGGWDVSWHATRDELVLNGKVTNNGEVTASGKETLTSSTGKKNSGSIELVGTISKGVFEGTLKGSGGSIQVTATHQ